MLVHIVVVREKPLHIMKGTILSGEVFDFHSHRECMEEKYEYDSKIIKQGSKYIDCKIREFWWCHLLKTTPTN